MTADTESTEDTEKKELYRKLIAEEVALFLKENQETIVKRAEKKLRKMLKKAN